MSEPLRSGPEAELARMAPPEEVSVQSEPEPDFAAEHCLTWVGDDDAGETESPRGHSGLEPSVWPN